MIFVVILLSLAFAPGQSQPMGEELVAPSPDLVPVHPTKEILARSLQSVSHDEAPATPKSGQARDAGCSCKASRGSQSPATKPFRKKSPHQSASRASKARVQQVDRELIESLSFEEFVELESELMVDFIQEHGNLLSALFGGEYERKRTDNSALEDRVLARLAARVRRLSEGRSARREASETAEDPVEDSGDKDVEEARQRLWQMLHKAQISRRQTSADHFGASRQAPGESDVAEDE